MANLKKTLVSFSVFALLLGDCSSVLALDEVHNYRNELKTEWVISNQQDFVFSNYDVLRIADNLYSRGIFTKEDYQIIYSAFTQRLGVKGVNKVVHLANGVMDVYINNIAWGTLVSLGGFGAGLLLGAIPGINASVAAGIAAIGGGIGGAYFGAERGVIARMKLVTEPPTQYSGQKTYYKVVSWREQ